MIFMVGLVLYTTILVHLLVYLIIVLDFFSVFPNVLKFNLNGWVE
jgi:hypothetical protein